MWDNIKQWAKRWLCKHNPFVLETPHLDTFISNIYEIQKDVQSVKEDIAQEKKYLELELRKRDSILTAMLDAMPDMMWFKDKEGRYIYANKVVRRDLLCCDHPIGLDDVTLAKMAKEKYGDENHTFGQKCANSDKITIEAMVPCAFVESGKVRGEHIKLEVHKNVAVDKETGIVLGTVGIGRDVTKYIEARKRPTCKGCEILRVFEDKRYEG